MPTAATRTRILDAAELIFAEQGYAGASIRCITSRAKVDLGAVRYHFGSKDSLFGEVMKRRLVPVCEERTSLLAELESRHGNEPPPVEEIVEAFLMPVVDLVTNKDHGRAWMKLIGRVRVEPGEYLDSVQGTYDTLLKRFLSVLARALPGLPKDELAYRFFFLFGAEVNTLLDDGTLRAMGDGLPDVYQDPEDVSARLIRFVSAGMKAPFPKEARNPFGDEPRRAKTEDPERRTRVG